MNNYGYFFIMLFAIMFFWIYSVDAFAQVQNCWRQGTLTVCQMPDGKIIYIDRPVEVIVEKLVEV